MSSIVTFIMYYVGFLVHKNIYGEMRGLNFGDYFFL